VPLSIAFGLAHFSLALAVGLSAAMGPDQRLLETICLIAWMAVFVLHMAYTRARGWRPLPLRLKQVLIGTAVVIAIIAGFSAQLQKPAAGSPGRLVFSLGIWLALSLGAFSVSRLLPPENEPARSPRGV
jgi:hypothetical protein